MVTYKMFALILCIASFSTVVVTDNRAQISCIEFSSVIKQAGLLVESETPYHSFLEQIGFVVPPSVFGYDSCNKVVDEKVKMAKILTVAAQIFKSKFNMPLDKFEAQAKNCMKDEICTKDKKINKHPKYRSIDGRGNNLKNPEWGAADTPFGRYGPKNYEDGIYKVKKSVTGSDLPNARLLVQEVLLKATKSEPPSMKYNLMAILIILFATHDFHYQLPMQTQCRKAGIGCCSADNRDTLPPELSNTACLPIEVLKDDPFYKNGNIGCLNMVRSEIAKYSHSVQTGEIMNRATAYMDLSLIYGNHESELNEIRLFKDGKLRLGRNNILPVDAKGNYLPSMARFVSTPIGSIFPALFARNHNHLAERLGQLNPHWKEEIIFQEARRINIANFQFNLITAKSIERVFNRPVNTNYSDEINAATLLEFSYTYRGGHYYIPSYMLFQNETYVETKYLQSDTIGKIELLENNFDDALRGATNQPINDGQYSDEIINRIDKNADGYGVDLIATDIQRGRDHGMPSFVEIRRKCNLSDINSLDDFNKIFNQKNVDLLKSIYKSHEDVDFYVAGLLEAFEHVANPLAGETFGCIIGANYNNVMGGDIYFYSHPENPYPFTKAQIEAVTKYSVPHLYCTNSRMKETNRLWSYVPHVNNPKVDCKNLPPMDLSAWKE